MIGYLTGRARALVKATQVARELRWRRPPKFAVGSRQDAPPTAYYLAPHLAAPSGGVRNMYRHVDAINAIGLSASVVHTPVGFRATWFTNSTRVTAARDVTLGPRDLLVVPEVYASGFARLPQGPRIVVFNQAAVHTFDYIRYEETGPGAPYAPVDNLVAILAVSEANADLLRFVYPRVPVHLVRPVVDEAIFFPAEGPRARQIAYLPHRRTHDREFLLHALRARGTLAGWDLHAIRGRSERGTAEIMRNSPIFLSFSEREGFGLPPAEAMASGCYVVGFTGVGGNEFFDLADCRPVPESDLLRFGQEVEEACRAYDTHPDTLLKLGRCASDRILSRYTTAGLTEDLRRFYGPLLAGA